MSSLRLALKQSLAESSAANPTKKKDDDLSSENEADFAEDEESEGEERNSAANKIQSRWKEGKKKHPSSLDLGASDKGASEDAAASTSTAAAGTAASPKPSVHRAHSPKSIRKNESFRNRPDDSQSAKAAKTVPPPTPEVLEWMRRLPIKRARRHVAPGLRVKVRFATKVKRDGKIVRKKKWFGGRVSAVSKEGSKIRIKYDDGTTEVTRFPDKDVLVDDVGNGVHQAPHEKFLPPPPPPEDDEEEEVGDTGEPAVEEEFYLDDEEEKDEGGDESEDDEGTTLYQEQESEPSSKPAAKDDSAVSKPSSAGGDDEPKPAPAADHAQQDPVSEMEAQPAEATKMSEDEQSAQSAEVAVELVPEDTEPLEKQPEPATTEPPEPAAVASQTEKTASEEDADSSDARERDDKSAERHDDDATSDRSERRSSGDSSQSKGKPSIRISKSKQEPFGNGSPREDAAAEPSKPDVAKSDSQDSSVDQAGNDDMQAASAAPEMDRTESKGTKRSHSDLDSSDNSGSKPAKRLHIHIPVRKSDPDVSVDAELAASKSPRPTGDAESSAAAPDASGSGAKDLASRSPKPKKQKRKRVDKGGSMDDAQPKRKKGEDSGAAQGLTTSPKRSPKTTKKIVLPSVDADAAAALAGVVGDLEGAPSMPEIGDGEDKLVDSERFEYLDLDEGALTPRSRAGKEAQLIVRSGRRAARQANERIASKQELVIPEVGKKKKKKRKEGDTTDEADLAMTEDDSQWVQCDKCGKWRIIPTIVVSTLPKQWYCADNIWDPKRASCDAPEQTAKQLQKEKKRRKKLQQRLLLEAQATAAATEGSEPKLPEEKPPRPDRARSPVPDAAGADTDADKKVSSSKSRTDSSDGLTSLVETGDVKGSRGRGRPRRTAQPKEAGRSSNASLPTSQNEDTDNLEWVQCEKCEKWRKLPAHVSADELPDVWFCSLNTWNPASASCDAPEDKADGLQDIGFHSGGGGSKLSYRNLIFGSTGRKANRPVSERTRAAESLFLVPNDDEDAPPIVEYANSSAFVSRTRSNAQANENEGMSVLELMSHSNLWAELRTAAAQPVSSSSTFSKQASLYHTYETLPPELQIAVRDLIVHILGEKSLSADEILLELQCRKFEGIPDDWSRVRPCCTVNVVVTTLCELVKEGAVDCLQKMGPNWSVKDWNPRYRRSKPRRVVVAASEPTKPLEDTLRTSRCMKIAKPWKRSRNQ